MMSAAVQEDVCNHVKVVVRVRPESQKERERNFSKVLQVVDKHMLVFDPKVEEVSFFHGKKLPYRDLNKRQNKDLKFMFDAVFDENASQLEVFECTTKIVLDGFLNGYNCTVLAYGATGAGKTHTMLGSPEDPGVMYLTMMELYNSMDRMKEEVHCAIAVSYLEVYNEQIRDLLVNSGPLAVREDPQKGVLVHGLTLHQPKSAEEILQMLDYGNKNRTQHPTDVNASSSRSHAVFQIYLRQQDKTASINQNVRIAKMCLIDLAGSERASATKSKGARFREGANINRSLLALGNVINALADPKRKKQHIPYRNSKLTRLLKDSLGGNCRTIIIAAVSPSSMFYDDTYNTLKYANRAKDIKSSLKSNVVSLDSHISQYVKICEEQKKEIIVLKEKLRAYEMKKAAIPENCALTNQQQVEIPRFREILKCVFANREEIRTEYLKLELRLKQNVLKTHYQKYCHEQIEVMCSPQRLEKATDKRDHRLALLKTRRLQMENKKEEEMKHFEENTNWLHRVENEMRLLGQDGHIPQELCRDLKSCHLKLEVKDLKTQIEYMRTLASLQEQQHKQTEKILSASLLVLRKQYVTLKNAGLANGVIEDDFKEFEQLMQREKAVVWADQMAEEEPKQNEQPTLSDIMAFPQLVSNRNTPCCTPSSMFSSKVKASIQHETDYGVPPVKRTRRKLMDSPLTMQSPERSSQSSPNNVADSLSKAFRPIVCTPENSRKPKETLCIETLVKQPSHTPVFQETSSFTVGIQEPLKQESQKYMIHNMPPDCHMNSTITLYENSTNGTDYPSSDASENTSQSSSSSSFLQRLGLPSKHPGPTHERPSYMAMTSAAERKRKLLSSISNSENLQEHVAAKRIRQDSSKSNKPLRVPKATGDKTRSWTQHDVLRKHLRNHPKENSAIDIKLRTSKKHFK
ncbi:kinesin-like protein KIF18A [Hemicordylus capensis]|uniref:kinesin-like protein KIF18A n=1 Tax=Hemicordylus capensis TaxID=884348 RepID=UPI0023044890|nr:kinesin-like protein KIF18A [Hemicordylus capensis]XP_053138808.1 kinesin-like protein KIF18A [Hemicordylus capensis]XP_053138809.1 kinesin-like protein KIF18A [Hemicordylus capensis]